MLSVQDVLAKGVEEFPRLCYLSEKDLLTAVSIRGDPVPIIPVIRKIFPGVSNIRFTELATSKNTLSLAVTATSSEEEGVLRGHYLRKQGIDTFICCRFPDLVCAQLAQGAAPSLCPSHSREEASL